MSAFKILFTLGATHTYYGATFRDLAFVVPAETRRLLRGGRLLDKVAGGRLHVFFETAEGGGPLVDLRGRKLRFGLRSENSFFRNFSALPFESAQELAFYSNAQNPAALAAARPYQPADGELEAELAGAGIFALVEVTLGAELYSGEPPAEFALSLAAREESLDYYLVLRNYSKKEATQMVVADLGFAEDDRPEVAFDQMPDAELPGGPVPDGAQVLLFHSREPVARRELGRRKIQLSRNGEILIQHLPQPGADRTGSSLILHLAKQL